MPSPNLCFYYAMLHIFLVKVATSSAIIDREKGDISFNKAVVISLIAKKVCITRQMQELRYLLHFGCYLGCHPVFYTPIIS